MDIRVTGIAKARLASAGSSAWAAHAPAFALPAAPASAASVSSTHPAAGLMALQDLPLSPEERRQKAIRRASAMLDGLAELQHDLLAGGMSPRTIDRLRAGFAGEPDLDHDGALAALLHAVETRCAVELAKLERSG